MNLAPDTVTTEAQRSTELLLLDYLRCTNPHHYALWCRHPDYLRSAEQFSDGAEDTSRESVGAELENETPFTYSDARFYRAAHTQYATTRLAELPSAMQGTYASRPWVAYWCLQAADLLGVVESDLLPRTPATAISAFLYSCLSTDTTCASELKAAAAKSLAASPNTEAEEQVHVDVTDNSAYDVVGFAGGPLHQLPHLAASYAACCALAVLSRHDHGAAVRRLPRAAIKRWLLALRNDDGSFRVHGGGESDIRASYCAAVITTLLCLDDPTTFGDRPRVVLQTTEGGGADHRRGDVHLQPPREYADDVRDVPVLTLQTAKFVASCQTHEGGFTCTATASEAHGAYTQCGLAALLLMRQPHLVHQASLRRWLAARQLNAEGGFNGRTNKLVDSCYSHWMGAAHVLLRAVEAYTKCFTPSSEPDKMGEGHKLTEGGDASASAPYLRARDVLALDHAQLLDATCLHTSGDLAWDRAETDHLHRVDLVDAFLGVDDACLREASAKKAAVQVLYDAVREGHEAAASANGKAERETDGSDDEKVADAHRKDSTKAFHTRQAFLYEDVGDYYFNQRKLQDYVLRCCQDSEIGGLMDKPGTAHDAYHTCYSLSGMSAAQNLQYWSHESAAAADASKASSASSEAYLSRAFARSYLPSRRASGGSFGVVLDLPLNSPMSELRVLRTTSPIFNVHQSAVLAAMKVWGPKTFL